MDGRGKINHIDKASKVVQDLRSWLLNDLGYNKFHPEMGTTLDAFVGQVVTPQLVSDIRDTVRKSLELYMEFQMQDLRERIEERGEPYIAIGLAEPSSLVRSWTNLSVKEDYGNISVRIGFTTFTDDYEEIKLILAGNFNENGID